MFVAIAGLTFASCSEENNAPSYDPNGVEVANAELKAKLQALGYNFNEKGNLLQDEKVQQTTSLDLSNANLTSAKGLDAFPNLTEVKLSNNKFEKSFDFTQLPEKVTSVDLTDNEIYEYPGLVDIKTEENGDETVTILRKLTKLDLPESAKYNCVEIPTYFSRKNGAIIQIQDKSEKLVPYTTLREIPDLNFRKTLKETFSSLFVGDNIDISKRIVDVSEKGQAIISDKNVKNVEGFQYILYNPSYVGSSVSLNTSEKCTIPYLKIGRGIYKLSLSNIDTTNGIDFTNAKSLCTLTISNDPGIESINISESLLFGQRDDKQEFAVGDNPSMLYISSCKKLKTIEWPNSTKSICALQLVDLPQLSKVDLSKIQAMYMLGIGLLPTSCIVTYPVPNRYPAGFLVFALDENIYNRQETKKFLDTYHEKLFQGGLIEGNAISYNWKQHYK